MYIQKKTYIDKDETDSMEKNKQMKKKQIIRYIRGSYVRITLLGGFGQVPRNKYNTEGLLEVQLMLYYSE